MSSNYSVLQSYRFTEINTIKSGQWWPNARTVHRTVHRTYNASYRHYMHAADPDFRHLLSLEFKQFGSCDSTLRVASGIIKPSREEWPQGTSWNLDYHIALPIRSSTSSCSPSYLKNVVQCGPSALAVHVRHRRVLPDQSIEKYWNSWENRRKRNFKF